MGADRGPGMKPAPFLAIRMPTTKKWWSISIGAAIAAASLLYSSWAKLKTEIVQANDTGKIALQELAQLNDKVTAISADVQLLKLAAMTGHQAAAQQDPAPEEGNPWPPDS